MLRTPRLARLALGVLLAFPGGAPRVSAAAPLPPTPGVLARVPVGDSLAGLPVPAYAHLRGPDGADYVLAFAPAAALAALRGSRSLAAAADPAEFVVATERRRGARARAASLAEVVLDDGRHVVARATAAQAEALAAAGFDLARLPSTPVVAAAPEPLPSAIAYDPAIAALVASVTPAAVEETAGGLSGVHPVTVGGVPVTLTTRHTGSGEAISRATQHAFEHLAASGLAPAFHSWAASGWSGRNVVADLPGANRPSEVVVVCAHLDDRPELGAAPGADDDASGATGVLLAARALAGTRFARTIRFALFTGEEQGLLGSASWAASLASAGANVVAVLNLDMIGWDGAGTPTVLLHTRPTSSPGFTADAAIADTFVRAAALYVEGALAPLAVADGEPASDHASFWNRGWPGVLAIEDDLSDLNPWFHTADDTLARLDLGYFTSFAKAAVATAAHLGEPAVPAATFTPLTPCRIVDTRDAGRPAGLGLPAMPAHGTRTFSVASLCGIPPDAVALVVNATVVEPAAPGWVTLYPDSGTPPGTSSVHFSPGRIRSCSSVVPLAPGALLGALNASAGPLHLVLDVSGAFR